MHKIINKKSIQKITAIIIIMIMCNFIMSGKVWAVESWMSIKEYQDLSIGGTDTKQDLYNKDTSPAVKKLCSAWNITAEQAIEMLKNHANDEKTLYVNKETYDNTAYTISDVKIKPTEEEKTKYNGDKQLNNFVSKIAKAVIYFVAIYLVLLELGYNLGGLVTGLGISSVIIAFAAQDIAKNLFGGFAIITDKPFSVGDWIEVGDYSGTVIDITFRSTKIKATDNTVITINNSTVVESFVKNWGNIDKRRYSTTLNLPLNTSEATVKRLLKKIEFALKTNPQIVPDSIQVHFENIKLEGIQIFIYLNSTQTGYDDFEAFKDGVNLEILKVLESENVKLSYPGQNIYIKEKPMNDTQDQK